MKARFLQFTKEKILFALIFFSVLSYLVGIPPVLGGAEFVALVVFELIISYTLSCVIVFLYKKHKKRRF